MQDTFPFLRSLTLPIDAGPGDARIVIDGDDGSITLYDDNGNRIVVLSIAELGLVVGADLAATRQIRMSLDALAANGAIFFGDVAGDARPGFIDQFGFGSYGEYAVRLASSIEDVDVDGRGTLILASERTSTAQPVTFRFRDDTTGSAVELLHLQGAPNEFIRSNLGDAAVPLLRAVAGQTTLTWTANPTASAANVPYGFTFPTAPKVICTVGNLSAGGVEFAIRTANIGTADFDVAATTVDGSAITATADLHFIAAMDDV